MDRRVGHSLSPVNFFLTGAAVPGAFNIRSRGLARRPRHGKRAVPENAANPQACFHNSSFLDPDRIDNLLKAHS
jgi:hypothetical protein